MKQSKYENNFEDFPPIGGLIVSKLVAEKRIKPRFMYREKRTRPEDSGWRIFTGQETQEYIDDPANSGIYNPSTILNIDPSIKDILLKGIGSVYERVNENDEWEKVTDYDMEDDYMTTQKIDNAWTIDINNLFERSVEDDGTLFYTTGDKSIRLNIWNSEKNKQALYEEFKQDIDNRDEAKSKTLNKYDFSDSTVLRIGFLIEEEDGGKIYSVIYGYTIIDKQFLLVALYFDEKEDHEWAINTWKSIKPGK